MSVTWQSRPHTLGSRVSLLLLRLAGWTPVLEPPPMGGVKFVTAAAPHTSNLDFWPGLFWKWATRIPLHWVGKRELFGFPHGIFMRAVGGIALDRRRAGGNFVDAAVSVIEREQEIVLLVAPEGSRGQAGYWKTGFYYMALEADVPIAVTALDWPRKRIGIVGYVQPTGDLKADFVRIAALLEGVRGRVAGNETPVIPRPDDQAGPGPA
ncbi:glycerol acyltransferase [Deinococcus aerolatus]|uniref:Glycerol acyltransferase n=1 Tax=Deinococcus aerolatus TaxID=522487 RepID=A0ABQ2GE92_9DEIO|nr:1-acyl-sn-glycerol-3-phosphate acyltransferase [Deinococcus aerolatus]GGL89392.1 glycerol acyltransferase [Deinococcus aerolatus]